MIVGDSLGQSPPMERYVAWAELTTAEHEALASELGRLAADHGLHDGHVVAFSIHLLACVAGMHGEWADDDRAAQTDAQARKSLRKLADTAQALADLLAGMETRASAAFNTELLRQHEACAAEHRHWNPASMSLLAGVARNGAESMRVRGGRPSTIKRDMVACESVVQVLMRHRIHLSQGGNFLRVCTVLFAAAGIPAGPREAIRRLQRERGKAEKSG